MTTLTTRATARRLGIPTQTLREWSASGVGPLPTLRGRYDSAEVDAWRAEMDAQLAPPLRSSVHAP